ncbi:MAG: 50S ribosomal protein L25/general stress protein Ctc [Bacteroidaceae bacterium]|nr:50S ribosomal protein L25/general stress protein Ctc [Bacteroidaceae bacterium]MBP9637024.1 50S ribosomal protein L25/general stress protein Ctc [Bacteroidaceae bacterium]
MKSIEVKGTLRADLGKKGSREIRKTDAVPAVIYGSQKDAEGKTIVTHFTVTNDQLRNLVYSPEIFLVDLTIDNTKCSAILKDIQFHPVTDRILHVDFYEVNPEQPIIMEVPVALNGLAEGVKAGGKLQLTLRKLKVRALASLIPEKLDINVAALGLGKTIQVGELSFENLEIVTAKEAVICGVRLTRAARGAMQKSN